MCVALKNSGRFLLMLSIYTTICQAGMFRRNPERILFKMVHIYDYCLEKSVLTEPEKNIKDVHWASKETYHFFRVTLTKIHSIKINHIWTQINKL